MTETTKSRELVIVRRTVVGKADHVANVVNAHQRRGELVHEVSWTQLSRRRARAEVVLLEPVARPQDVIEGRLLPRLRQRAWPANRPWYFHASRILAAAVVLAAAAGIGWLVYDVVLGVIGVVRFVHKHWLLVVLAVLAILILGGKKTVQAVAHLCDKCGGSGIL